MQIRTGTQLVALCLALILSVTVCSCRTLGPRPAMPDVYALPPATFGPLAEASARVVETCAADESGFLLLSRNDEAMMWRLALIDNATSSIDAQYFIWGRDEAGKLLFDRLLRAADRGVRVRLQVDDFFLAPHDRDIAALCLHPNFDFAVFNPQGVRNSKLGGDLEYLFNLKGLNRRMHNKLLVVDGRMAIVGGRNISNAYFGLSPKYNFTDLDVLVAGPVVQEISHAFDEYWNADFSYPGIAMFRKASIRRLETIRENITNFLSEHRDTLVSYPTQPLQWKDELLQLPALMKRGEAHFIQDEPVKEGDEELRLIDMLRNLVAPNHEELIIVSPYLIPEAPLLERLQRQSSEGVIIKILAPSMAANNKTIVHSHYKKYRRHLLARGELYESRHDPSPELREMADVAPVRADFIFLHIKAAVGDRQRCFIGSLNLDPRAMSINTENGLYIESPDLGAQMAEHFDALMAPDNAWRVYLNEKNKLRWESDASTVSKQPARSFRQRIADFFYRLLPIESQL